MTQCTHSEQVGKGPNQPLQRVLFGVDQQRRQIVIERSKLDLTTDAGMLLVDHVAQSCGLLDRLAECIDDRRQSGKVMHDAAQMLTQRVLAINCGYEDGNDHHALRRDLMLQHAVGKPGQELASPATLCRFENEVGLQELLAMQSKLVGHFVTAVGVAPKHIVLDVDSSDFTLHGEQVGRRFNRYYGGYCFTPLFITCGGFVLTCWLCRSDNSDVRVAALWLKRVIGQIRCSWPDTKIVVRGDCAFSTPRILNLCDELEVHPLLGFASNERLKKMAGKWQQAARRKYRAGGPESRAYGSLSYQTRRSWPRHRRVIVRAEYGQRNDNPRFVVTSLKGDPRTIYERVYCARGDMENRIKENKVDMFGQRVSCHNFLPNQYRLTISVAAYLLHNELRRTGCIGTELERAEAGTIRSRLIKFGGEVAVSVRRYVVKLAHSNPMGTVLLAIAQKLMLIAEGTCRQAQRLRRQVAASTRRSLTSSALRVSTRGKLTCSMGLGP